MSKRVTKNLQDSAPAQSPPDLKKPQTEEIPVKADFAAASEAPLGFKIDRTSGVILLSQLLRRVVAAHIGPEQLPNMHFEYDYDPETECHIFEISVKPHLPGERKMGKISHYQERMKLKDQLKDFWRMIDLFSTTDDVIISPDHFGVAFTRKIEFFKTLRDFIDATTAESLELPLYAMPEQETPEDFKPYKFNPAQSHREFISAIHEMVEMSRESVDNIDILLLQSAFNKSYTSLAEYNAYSYASFKEINPDTLAFTHFLAVIEQRIRHEDDLGPERDEHFQNLYQPQNFSIN